jgi:hypothetical protein
MVKGKPSITSGFDYYSASQPRAVSSQKVRRRDILIKPTYFKERNRAPDGRGTGG